MSLDVLLPFYGDPGYLRTAVRSVQAQSSPHWRLIVTDDCYPDPSIGPWFASLDDPRIVYSRNDTNLGANRNYTHALSKARADWVVVMGADDEMAPRFVERTTELIDRHGPNVGVVQGGVRVIDADGAPVRTRVDAIKARSRPRGAADQLLGGEDLLVSILHGNWTYFPSLVWHRETIRSIGFRPEFHIVQDLALLVDVLRAGHDMVVDSEATFRYRRHRGSDSALKTVTGRRFAEERSYFALIADELESTGCARAARAARWHVTSRLHALSLVPAAVAVGHPKDAVRLLAHATAAPGPRLGRASSAPWSHRTTGGTDRPVQGDDPSNLSASA